MTKKTPAAIENEISRLKKQRKTLMENAMASKFSVLLENEINEAELIIASRDLADRLTKIATDITKIQTDVLPISDSIRDVFGPGISDGWESTISAALTASLEAIRTNRDAIANANLTLEGKEAPIANDMANFDDSDVDFDAGDVAETDDEVSSEEEDDMFSGEEVSGRIKKESIQLDGMITESVKTYSSKMQDYTRQLDESRSVARKSSIERKMKEEREVYEKTLAESSRSEIGQRLLMQESMDNLVTWFLESVQPRLAPEEFAKVAVKVQNQRMTNPSDLAGYIGSKKYGNGLIAQLSNPLAGISDDVFNESVVQSDWTVEFDYKVKDRSFNSSLRVSETDKKAAEERAVKLLATQGFKDVKITSVDHSEYENDGNPLNESKDELIANTSDVDQFKEVLGRKKVGEEVSPGSKWFKLSDKAMYSKFGDEISIRRVLGGKVDTKIIPVSMADEYGIKLNEDITPTTPTGPTGGTPKPKSPSLNNAVKKDGAQAVAALAAKTASNPAAKNNLQGAINSLPGKDRIAAQKMADKMKADGAEPKDVKDFLSQSENVLKEGVDYKNILSKAAMKKAALSQDVEDYSVPGRIVRAELGYVSAAGKFAVRIFTSIDAAQQEAYKIIANGGELADVDIVRREKLTPEEFSTLIDIDTLENISVHSTNANGKESTKDFRDVAKAEKFINTVKEKGGDVLSITIDRVVSEEREGASKPSDKKKYLERSLKNLTSAPTHDEALAENYAKRLSKIVEAEKEIESVEVKAMKIRNENELEESSPKADNWYNAYKDAAKFAKESSKNGYVQHVDKDLDGYVVQDFKSDKTVASFENGKQLKGNDFHLNAEYLEGEELKENAIGGPWYKDFKSAAKYALDDSKNGYVQHVEKYDGGYLVSDWYDYEVTVASFENGRQTAGEPGYEYNEFEESAKPKKKVSSK